MSTGHTSCSRGEDVGLGIFGILVFGDARCPRSDFASAFARQSRSLVLRHVISSQPANESTSQGTSQSTFCMSLIILSNLILCYSILFYLI